MKNEYTYDVSMFRDTFETRFTYLNGFLRNVSRFGARPALHDPLSGRRWTCLLYTSFSLWRRLGAYPGGNAGTRTYPAPV